MNNKPECKHDWAYDKPLYSHARICRLCSRKEQREMYGNSFNDFNFTEWTLLIKDMNYDPTTSTK